MGKGAAVTIRAVVLDADTATAIAQLEEIIAAQR